MFRALFITSLIAVGASAFAKGKTDSTCKHNSETAKAGLSNIYSGEKAHFAEKKTFSDSFGDIGVDPNFDTSDGAECDNANWVYEIHPLDGGDKFTATAYSRLTREEYTINEKKEIRKAGEISATPSRQISSVPADDTAE